jgi:hypothetical protein
MKQYLDLMKKIKDERKQKLDTIFDKNELI